MKQRKSGLLLDILTEYAVATCAPIKMDRHYYEYTQNYEVIRRKMLQTPTTGKSWKNRYTI